MVRANPDLELVNSDAEKNTLTIRDKKTGKTMTINAERKTQIEFSRPYYQAGQSCISTQRVYVHESIASDLPAQSKSSRGPPHPGPSDRSVRNAG
mgnify:CR=1 FL=1